MAFLNGFKLSTPARGAPLSALRLRKSCDARTSKQPSQRDICQPPRNTEREPSNPRRFVDGSSFFSVRVFLDARQGSFLLLTSAAQTPPHQPTTRRPASSHPSRPLSRRPPPRSRAHTRPTTLSPAVLSPCRLAAVTLPLPPPHTLKASCACGIFRMQSLASGSRASG